MWPEESRFEIWLNFWKLVDFIAELIDNFGILYRTYNDSENML